MFGAARKILGLLSLGVMATEDSTTQIALPLDTYTEQIKRITKALDASGYDASTPDRIENFINTHVNASLLGRRNEFLPVPFEGAALEPVNQFLEKAFEASQITGLINSLLKNSDESVVTDVISKINYFNMIIAELVCHLEAVPAFENSTNVSFTVLTNYYIQAMLNTNYFTTRVSELTSFIKAAQEIKSDMNDAISMVYSGSEFKKFVNVDALKAKLAEIAPKVKAFEQMSDAILNDLRVTIVDNEECPSETVILSAINLRYVVSSVIETMMSYLTMISNAEAKDFLATVESYKKLTVRLLYLATSKSHLDAFIKGLQSGTTVVLRRLRMVGDFSENKDVYYAENSSYVDVIGSKAVGAVNSSTGALICDDIFDLGKTESVSDIEESVEEVKTEAVVSPVEPAPSKPVVPAAAPSNEISEVPTIVEVVSSEIPVVEVVVNEIPPVKVDIVSNPAITAPAVEVSSSNTTTTVTTEVTSNTTSADKPSENNPKKTPFISGKLGFILLVLAVILVLGIPVSYYLYEKYHKGIIIE